MIGEVRMRKYAKVELIVNYWKKEEPTIRVIRRFFEDDYISIVEKLKESNLIERLTEFNELFDSDNSYNDYEIIGLIKEYLPNCQFTFTEFQEYDFVEIDKNDHVMNDPQSFYAIDDKTAVDGIINDYSGSNMDKDIIVEVARLELNEYNYVYHYVPIARLKGGVENDS